MKLDNELTIKRADASDCRDIWQWRNHNEVRKWCFNKNEIPYDQHKAWFDKNIDNPRILLYVGLTPEGIKVGQVRFDLQENDESLVNVCVNPELFGKGYGTKLIDAATRKFMEQQASVGVIVAEIFDDNIASKKIFTKARYVYDKVVEKEGLKVNVYLFKRNI